MIDGITNIASPTFEYLPSGLARHLPEPQSGAGMAFRAVMGGVNSLLAGAAGGFGGLSPEYMDLINKQLEVQQQMQLVSLHSNIEKSRHETQMSAIRNIRAG